MSETLGPRSEAAWSLSKDIYISTDIYVLYTEIIQSETFIVDKKTTCLYSTEVQNY
jgi:hypothetical protein